MGPARRYRLRSASWRCCAAAGQTISSAVGDDPSRAAGEGFPLGTDELDFRDTRFALHQASRNSLRRTAAIACITLSAWMTVRDQTTLQHRIRKSLTLSPLR